MKGILWPWHLLSKSMAFDWQLVELPLPVLHLGPVLALAWTRSAKSRGSQGALPSLGALHSVGALPSLVSKLLLKEIVRQRGRQEAAADPWPSAGS